MFTNRSLGMNDSGKTYHGSAYSLIAYPSLDIDRGTF